MQVRDGKVISLLKKSQIVTSTSRNVTSRIYDFNASGEAYYHIFCSFLLKPNALYSHEEVSILLKNFTDST